MAAYRPGDLVLTHRDALFSRMIAFGQRLRMRGDRAKYAHWSHAALIVSKDGDLIEALGNGVTRSHISKYADVEHVVINTTNSLPCRLRVVRFAEHAVGRRYGWLEILSLALYFATAPLPFVPTFRFGLDNQMICSAFAAEALCRTDAIFPDEPLYTYPGELGEYYHAPSNVGQ